MIRQRVNLVDSHCHLSSSPLKEHLTKVLTASQVVGVGKIVVPMTNSKELNWFRAHLREKCLFFALGIHPSAVEETNWSRTRDEFITMISQKPTKIVALGEVGLDKTYPVSLNEQLKLFLNQLKLAEEVHLPLIIHNRGCRHLFYQLIQEGTLRPPAVFHSFIGRPSWLQFLLEKGFYIGLGGLALGLSFNPQNWQLIKKWKSRLLLETDAPFLLPPSLKGREKYNQPANVRIIAEVIAPKLGVSLKELAKITTQNAVNFFQLNED